MTQTHEAIASAAMALPPDEKVELAERLLRSLDGPEQAEIDAAWGEEADKRMEQIVRGQSAVIPGDVLMEQLRGRYK